MNEPPTGYSGRLVHYGLVQLGTAKFHAYIDIAGCKKAGAGEVYYFDLTPRGPSATHTDWKALIDCSGTCQRSIKQMSRTRMCNMTVVNYECCVDICATDQNHAGYLC